MGIALEKHKSRYWIAIALLLVATIYIHFLPHGEGSLRGEVNLTSFPSQIADWTGDNLPFSQEVRDELGVDDYLLRSYADHRGRSVVLYVGYYRSQRKGKGIHSPKHCYPGGGWSLVEKGLERIDVGGERELVVTRLVFRKNQVINIVLYWFQSRGRIINNEYLQRIYMVLDAILHNRTDGALVRVSAIAYNNDVIQTLEMERQFVNEAYSHLVKHLSQ